MAQESRYSKIFVKIWHSKDFRMLSEEGKMLFLYLLTSPHRNMGGFYYLPLPYLCFDVGIDEKRVIKAFEELTDKDMALYDYDTQVVLIKKWFCYNPIENENQAKGLNKQLAEIPKSKLFKPFVDCVKEYCKYIESILKGFDIPSENPSETLSKPYTKPGTGTGTGTESNNDDDDNNARTCETKKIISTLETEFGRPATPSEVEKLFSFLDNGFEDEVICEAIRRAREQGNPKLAYISGILNNWNSGNIKTMAAVAIADEQFEKVKEGKIRGPTKDTKSKNNGKSKKFAGHYPVIQ